MILGYGSEEQGRGSIPGRLKAHVNGVGHLSQSQAQDALDGPPGLLFLSDGTLQIPAVLTASAWHHLQETEERESFNSLVNTTVYIQSYQLLFHMAPEHKKCMFFLSVGELAMTAVDMSKDNVPSCTILHSVREKIHETWRSLSGQEESQASQLVGDLSELLWEWRRSDLEDMLEDIGQLLKMPSCPPSPQPSTSTSAALPAHPHPTPTTEWEEARDRCPEGTSFTVPIKFLLIPEDALQLGTPHVESRTQRSEPAAASEAEQADLPSVAEVEWRLDNPGFSDVDYDGGKKSPLLLEERTLHDVITEGMMDSRPLANPWDMFPPPGDSSSSESSPAATQASPLPIPAAAPSKPDNAGMETSTQLKPLQSVSPTELSLTPSDPLPPSGQQRADSAQQNLQNGGSPIFEEEPVVLNFRKVKRKRSEVPAEAPPPASGKEEEEEALSPPSWLFESGESPGDSDGGGQTQGGPAGRRRKTPTAHSDGSKFSYSYQVSGQNLQDFSKVKVSDSLLHWAVKYLVVPKQTDASATFNQKLTDLTEVTPPSGSK